MDPVKSPRLRPELLDELIAIYDEEGPLQIRAGHELPSFDEIRTVLHVVRHLLFPGYAGDQLPSGPALRALVHARLADAQMRLLRQGYRVRIYQGVTRGAISLPKGAVRALSTRKRHPTIEDDVIIYANATILGGATVIGRGAVIGGNAFITESVPAGERRLAQ